MEVQIQVCPVGRYVRNGEEFTITPEMIQSAIDYSATVRPAQDTVIDYEHQTMNAPMNGKAAPASGWIKKLVNAGERGLVAVVEWTEEAARYIKGQQYKYLSPVLAWDYEDETSGKVWPMVLLNAALTNFPFLPDIAQVVARRYPGVAQFSQHTTEIQFTASTNGGTKMAMDYEAAWAEVCDAVGMPVDSDPAKVSKFITQLGDIIKTVKGGGGAAVDDGNVDLDADGDPGMDKDADGMTKAIAPMRSGLACSREIGKLLGVTKMTRADIVRAVRELKDGKATTADEVQQLRARVETMEQEKAFADFLNTPDASGVAMFKRIEPSMTEKFKSFYRHDPEGTKQLIASMRPLDLEQRLDTKHTPAGDPKEVVLTDEEKTMCLRNGIDEEIFLAGKKRIIAQRATEKKEG